MKKQLLIVGIIIMLGAIGLSGCNQITDSGIEIKLINKCNSELHLTLKVFGTATIPDPDDYSKFTTLSSSKEENSDLYIDVGGEKSEFFNNLRVDFTDRNNVEVFWFVNTDSNLGHWNSFILQKEFNATSPSILRNGITLTFHQDGTISVEN